MKIPLNRLIQDEKGQAMLLALILLLISGLMAAPLLAHMGSGLLTGQVYETRTAELYAADAGVEDAVWKIQTQVPEVKFTQCYQSTNYTIRNVNGNSVAVNITSMRFVNNVTLDYRIVSTATGDGSGTKIDAYITGTNVYGNYSGLLNQIITSQGEIDLKAGVILNPSSGPNGPAANYTGAWPDTQEEVDLLKEFYWLDVKNAVPYYTSATLKVEDYPNGIGPLYWNRTGPLYIENSGGAGLTLKLNGTVYITGDTLIGATNNKFTLDLNGHTIFVASPTVGKNALEIGTKCTTIKGPGVIIAVGDVYFGPDSGAGTNDKPVFVLSVLGTTTIRPGINVFGAIAGSVKVEVQSGNDPTITYPTGGFGSSLNFPTGIQKLTYSIASWEVNPQ